MFEGWPTAEEYLEEETPKMFEPQFPESLFLSHLYLRHRHHNRLNMLPQVPTNVDHNSTRGSLGGFLLIIFPIGNTDDLWWRKRS